MARITLVPSSNSTSPRVESTIFFPSTHNDTPPSCQDISPSSKTLRSVAYGSSLRSLLSHLSMRKIKRALASLPLRVEVCVCAIIESHRNRITHGYRDGRETMVVSFANRCQGGLLCSFPSLGIVIRGKKRSKAFRWFDRGMFYRSIELDNGRCVDIRRAVLRPVFRSIRVVFTSRLMRNDGRLYDTCAHASVDTCISETTF